ncbi:aspartic proteinase CDR1-like [Dioscorea cayenensis subsp. rotundata]|uniref:Aspartic proteinase CDR1-like n=1 Tax=Dioscorea cayennensis subsp. rotundata TaxID=55577 RepID=A0AB40B218_DIOCR|nr:aspartic proteinase CDR1-like [Dioscorea cayenensis subsp. rotundata]
MPRPLDRATSATALILLAAHLLLALEHSSAPAFLPLAFSKRRPDDAERRQLRADLLPDRPIARMRLYDDLLTNGYYTARIWIGTPPQEFALIVDTGSTVTYVPCSPCDGCGSHQDPQFQPELSKSYEPVKCNADCTCNEELMQCTYERQYAEMSSSSGVLGKDIVSFGNQSTLEPQRAVFGCENSETGDLFSQHADGIMGLGRGELSIMDQLVEKGVINDSFSLCYGGMDIGGGAMVLGGVSPPPEMVFSRSDPFRSPYYNVDLKEIHVAGKRLQIDPKVFDRKHGTILDSGTTYAYLPEEAFTLFRDSIINNLHLKQIPGPDPNYKDICFSGAGSDTSQLSKTFPQVDMVFGSGQKLSLSPENYLFRHLKVHDAYCMGFFPNGEDPSTLLGGIIVRNILVTYDRQNRRIGFWKTNCSHLWEALHMDVTPSSMPSASHDKNYTGENSSAASSSAPQSYNLPGQFQIGAITFEISLSVKYPELVPHDVELAEVIAYQLEVDANQVHLLNFTNLGNSTLIKCAIIPSDSTNFISNDTAMSIISRLAEHRVHLPKNLGSYQLVKWKVDPPLKRKWWHEHLVPVIFGILVAAVLSLSMLVVLRRYRCRVSGTYTRVEATSSEQELQTF